MPSRTTEDYEGPAMSKRVQAALNAALVGEEDEIEFQPPENLPTAFNPYLNYNPEESSRDRDRRRDDRDDRGHRPKSSMRRSKGSSSRRSRPGTAGRRGRGASRKESEPVDDFTELVDYVNESIASVMQPHHTQRHVG